MSYQFVPHTPPRREPDEMIARARTLRTSLAQRRSVRQFSAEPVPRAVIEEAIRAAGTAPSGANQQPWTFVVVSEPKLKQQLREAAEAEEKESYERRMSEEWLAALEPLGTNWEKPHLTQAPYVIVVFAQTYGVEPGEDSEQARRVKHYYVQESVGIAVGMLIATLHEAGLATLTHTPSPMRFLRELLGRPEQERAYVVMPVGYPAPECTVPAIPKKPLDEISVWL